MSMNGTLPTPEDIKRVKGLGFLHDKTTADCFNARVITRNGRLQPDEIRAIVDAAEKFGSGEIAMTTRLTIEVQRIPFANIEPFCAFLAEHGLETGGTGPKVRPIVACKGTTCQYGLIDTVAFSRTIHERFYKGWHDVRLPHKFKIAVGGCPNNCVKPDLNDLGVIGQRVPSHDLSKCRGCKVCMVEKSCPSKAAHVENGKLHIDEKCLACGVCTGKCPFKAVRHESPVVYRIYVGGTWGKQTRMGTPLSRFVTRAEIEPLLEKTMLWFKENAMPKERLGKAIDRLGIEKFEHDVFSDDLLNRREEILAK